MSLLNNYISVDCGQYRQKNRKEQIMRKVYRTLSAIEYAFVCSMIASFSMVGVAGLFFGFQLGQWSEWQGTLVGVTVFIAGLVGAVFGVRLALDTERLNLHRTNHISGRHQTH